MARTSLLQALLLREVSKTAYQCLNKLTDIGVLFFAVLLNALISINEINSLYNQRPIIEKQAYVTHLLGTFLIRSIFLLTVSNQNLTSLADLSLFTIRSRKLWLEL